MTGWVKPRLPPCGPHVRFRRVQTWSARAVRWSSCAILLRPGPAAGEENEPPEPATNAATNKCLAQNNKSRHVSRATKDRHEWASTVADMSERYPLVYRLLKDAGHDPAKAVELLLDAKRGDEWALIWIRVLRRNRKG